MSAAGALEAATLAATWLLTWWVHAGVAALAALAAGRLLLRRPADRDPVWRLALLLPPLTALAATAAGGSRPGAGPLDVALVLRRLLPGVWAPPTVDLRVHVLDGVRTATREVADPAAAALAFVVLAVAIACLLAASIALGRRHRALRSMLRGRRALDVGQPAPPATAAGGTPIRLTVAARLDSPVALGRREVCVPPAFLALPPAQQRAVLAHEAAHLERRDPWWLLAFEVVAALGAAQPLVRRVLRAWRRDAELCCDELAARRTGDPRALVASLAALARPFDAAARDRVPAPAAHDSPLVERAERLLALDLRGHARPRSLLPLLGAALLALLALAPAVSARGALAVADAPVRGGPEDVELVTVMRR